LRAFEAAARLLSFKAAAHELGITPTSVSNQIRKLERDSNCQLFVRKARHVELTQDGHLLAKTTSTAFQNLREGMENLAMVRRKKVVLGVGPIFGARWLIPRLQTFIAAHPDIELTLQQGQHISKSQRLDTDLAIDWGDETQCSGDWSGLQTLRLLEISYRPVASPALLERCGDLETAADLARFSIIHQQDKSDWETWLCRAGAAGVKLVKNIVMADSNMAMQAAMDGQGIALGVFPLIEAEVVAGQLVCPFSATFRPAQAYYLLANEAIAPGSAADAVRQWLLAQAGPVNSSQGMRPKA
jgi:LysR family glycine cleavage system transcriptional activator